MARDKFSSWVGVGALVGRGNGLASDLGSIRLVSWMVTWSDDCGDLLAWMVVNGGFVRWWDLGSCVDGAGLGSWLCGNCLASQVW